MPARCLMFQGTGSDVGKSLIVAGLCRAFTRQGFRVAPFKPQNMSNNAAVTADGGEIGRAQALQAQACRIAPTVDMNPVLLKPQSEVGAQIIVQGRMTGTAKARDYQALKPGLMGPVLESFARLRANHDLVLVEGAGSAAEVNLRSGDIANMGFATEADVPVIVIGDIDRGGVIASIVGIGAVLDDADARMVKGFIVNRMRGDASLFHDGMRFIRERTGWSPIGLVPYFEDAARLPAEDSVGLASGPSRSGASLKIAVIAYPRLSNFDDFDPLIGEPDVDLIFIRPGEVVPADRDLIVLPGSKATIADLASLRREGWDVDIAAHRRRGGAVLGICGGYQMLGSTVDDPDGIEGPASKVPGLGLLDVDTVLTGSKALAHVSGHDASGRRFEGYEMHVGRTVGSGPPMLTYDDGRCDGTLGPDGRVSGCYVHGLFGHTTFREGFLAGFGAASKRANHAAMVDAVLDRLADHQERHLDLDALLAIAR